MSRTGQWRDSRKGVSVIAVQCALFKHTAASRLRRGRLGGAVPVKRPGVDDGSMSTDETTSDKHEVTAPPPTPPPTERPWPARGAPRLNRDRGRYHALPCTRFTTVRSLMWTSLDHTDLCARTKREQTERTEARTRHVMMWRTHWLAALLRLLCNQQTYRSNLKTRCIVMMAIKRGSQGTHEPQLSLKHISSSLAGNNCGSQQLCVII